MKIRSVTFFCPPQHSPTAYQNFIAAAQTRFHIEVQTVRVAFPPLAEWASTVDEIIDLDKAWKNAGTFATSLGSIRLQDDKKWLDVFAQVVDSADMVFACAEVADTNGNISVERALEIAKLTQRLSKMQPNGFGNLFFTAIANCPPLSPYFPVAYGSGKTGFALAIEAADLARTVLQSSTTIPQAMAALTAAIEQETTQLEAVAEQLSAEFDLPFFGIDFSLAPFPTNAESLGGAVEDIGFGKIGSHGSLFASGIVTNALQNARFKKCGFNGLMLPVLEDSILAERAAEGTLTVQSLLSYGAVCGVGLDTIPLPGNATTQQLAAIYLDVAMLASRLNKPLTARLMPMPGLEARAEITFDFPFFANGRVMGLQNVNFQGLLSQTVNLHIDPIDNG